MKSSSSNFGLFALMGVVMTFGVVAATLVMNSTTTRPAAQEVSLVQPVEEIVEDSVQQAALVEAKPVPEAASARASSKKPVPLAVEAPAATPAPSPVQPPARSATIERPTVAPASAATTPSRGAEDDKASRGAKPTARATPPVQKAAPTPASANAEVVRAKTEDATKPVETDKRTLRQRALDAVAEAQARDRAAARAARDDAAGTPSKEPSKKVAKPAEKAPAPAEKPVEKREPSAADKHDVSTTRAPEPSEKSRSASVKPVYAPDLVPGSSKPTVVTASGDKAWVKLDERTTVIVTKGEVVPGLGTFHGLVGREAKFDAGAQPVNP